jgi:succinate dehydrogenase/fumarate reductase flavoprotein subunit
MPLRVACLLAIALLLMSASQANATDAAAPAATKAELGCKDDSRCIIVIGAGLAGLTAAVQLQQLNQGFEVLLLEKEQRTGGNSAKASSGINAHSTPQQTAWQIANNITADDGDAHSTYLADTLRSGGVEGDGCSKPALVQALADDVTDGVAFLHAAGSAPLDTLFQCGAHSHARTHRNAKGPNVGFTVTSALRKWLLNLDNGSDVTIHTGVLVESLVRSDSGSIGGDGVTGVKVRVAVASVADSSGDDAGGEKETKTMTVSAAAVLLASGGFGANRAMLEKYAGSATAARPTTNGAWAQGDGVEMGAAAGAQLYGMQHVQVRHDVCKHSFLLVCKHKHYFMFHQPNKQKLCFIILTHSLLCFSSTTTGASHGHCEPCQAGCRHGFSRARGAARGRWHFAEQQGRAIRE